MKRLNWLVAAVAVILFTGVCAMAEDKVQTVSGKASCGGCTGAVDGCSLLITDASGGRWVLTGDSESFKAAFKARMSGKAMTATLAGEPVTKKAKDGKEYKQAKVADVKIAES